MRLEPGGSSEPSIAQCFSGVLYLPGYNHMAPPLIQTAFLVQNSPAPRLCT